MSAIHYRGYLTNESCIGLHIPLMIERVHHHLSEKQTMLLISGLNLVHQFRTDSA